MASSSSADGASELPQETAEILEKLRETAKGPAPIGETSTWIDRKVSDFELSSRYGSKK